MVDVEVVVVGGGVMGAAAAWQLAMRGREVLVVEQFGPGHLHGSSHGNARIFRLAYPDADYLALARAGLPLWDRLEAETGRTLRRRVGELDHGEPAVVAEIIRQLAAAAVPHEVLDPAQAARRWPGLVVDRAAVFHPDGGTTDAAATVAAATELAVHHGAEVRHHCTVARLEPADDHVVVHLRTDGRRDGPDADRPGSSDPGADRIVARTVVVTAGAWTAHLLADHVSLPPLVVTREQPVHFTATTPGTAGTPGAGEPWPSFIHYSTDGPAKTSGVDEPVWGYGLPTPDGRLKLGEHHTGEVVADAARLTGQAVDRASLDRVVAYARQWVPGVDPASAEPERCLYTSTATTDFVLDRVGRVVVGAGFSGHGFKFAPRIGQVLADLVDGGRSPPRFRVR